MASNPEYRLCLRAPSGEEGYGMLTADRVIHFKVLEQHLAGDNPQKLYDALDELVQMVVEGSEPR